MELRRLLMEGEGAGAGSDDVTFSASLVSDKLTTMIADVSDLYNALKALTGRIDAAVGNDGDAVLRGAVADIKTDWAGFQAKYQKFQAQMEAVRAAIIKAGASYDTFNSQLLSNFQEVDASAAAGGNAGTSAVYGG